MEEKIENEKTGQDLPMLMKHHVLLLFGDDNDIQMIVQQFSNINRPRIIFITEKEKEYPHFTNQKYVKNIVCEGMNDQQLNNYIVSSLWELDCYFNEKGNEIDRYSPKSIVKGLETDNSFFSINILLTGLCRSGKSTFINLLTEKLIALESNESESVTLKVSEYYIHRNDDKKEHGAIKLIDTPGLCDDRNVNIYKYQFNSIK
jgi:ribosome biogenesis GTPase A